MGRRNRVREDNNDSKAVPVDIKAVAEDAPVIVPAPVAAPDPVATLVPEPEPVATVVAAPEPVFVYPEPAVVVAPKPANVYGDIIIDAGDGLGFYYLSQFTALACPSPFLYETYENAPGMADLAWINPATLPASQELTI